MTTPKSTPDGTGAPQVSSSELVAGVVRRHKITRMRIELVRPSGWRGGWIVRFIDSGKGTLTGFVPVGVILNDFEPANEKLCREQGGKDSDGK